jgi:hypothetical protein
MFLRYSPENCLSVCPIEVDQVKAVKDAGHEESKYVLNCSLLSDHHFPTPHKSAVALRCTFLIEE